MSPGDFEEERWMFVVEEEEEKPSERATRKSPFERRMVELHKLELDKKNAS